MRSSMMQPALIGGLVGGVLSALPIISAGNFCCCLWVVSGGIVAAYMLQQNEPGSINVGNGALVGLFSGLIGAVVYLLLSIPITLIMAPMQRQIFERFIEAGDIPPEFRSYASSMAGGLFGLVIGFSAMLVAGAIFSTIGGMLGAAIFRKPLATPVENPPPSM